MILRRRTYYYYNLYCTIFIYLLNLNQLVKTRMLTVITGEAYRHYKWSTGRGENAPFWTSNVNCKGDETSFDACEKVPYGHVTDCEGRHYAGALCYQKYGRNKIHN